MAAGQYVLQADLPGFGRSSQAITVPGPNLTFTMALEALDVPGAAAPAAPAGEAVDTQALLDRIKALEQRIGELESSTVLSEPETRVRRVEVYVDASGNQTDEPVPGAKPEVTYQRERVYRRQTINEKIEEALADAEEHSVKVGVSAAITPQFANAESRRARRRRTDTRISWRPPTCSSRPASRRTRCSSPTSSA